MEMVETKIIALLSAAVLAASCSPSFTWREVPVDGHRTGVTAASANNVPEAMGTISDGVYTAPNGTVFDCGSTPVMARAMLDVQPRMSVLKQTVGYCATPLLRTYPESPLGDLIADLIASRTAEITGRRVDVGIINNGGIRIDLPEGEILLDDLKSMLPFKNRLCLVVLKGADLQYIFDFMARTRMMSLSGVRIVTCGGKVESALIGGKPLDPEAIYNVATVDFLLDGGDSLYVARNAKELIITEEDDLYPLLYHVQELTSRGDSLKSFADGRIVIKDWEEKK